MAAQFQVTSNVYPPDGDQSKICKTHFGEDAVPADFADLHGLTEDAVQQVMSDLNIGVTRNEAHYFVKVNGQSLYPGTNKHAYFFENHGGEPPSFFGAIDNYAGLNVGVANKYGHVVCHVGAARRKLVEAEPVAEENEEKAAGKRWFGW